MRRAAALALLAAFAAGCHLVIDPERVPKPSDVTALAAGQDHSCALVSREVFCWGRGDFNQLGIGQGGDSRVPVLARGLNAPADAVAAGALHTCATAGGRTTCWGYNEYGELGAERGPTGPFQVPDPVADGPVAAGQFFTCAIHGGSVACWGHNDQAQLGNPNAGGKSAAPVEVLGLPEGPAEAIAAGTSHACALVGGAVSCWGDSAPPSVAFASGATAIAAGCRHTCAIAGGRAACWGGDELGQSRGAADVPGTVTAIAAGCNHTCAIAGGNVWCWGDDARGQLGGGAGSVVQVTTDRSASVIAAGGDHACALTSAGVQCWGDNARGQLGDDSAAGPSTVTFP